MENYDHLVYNSSNMFKNKGLSNMINFGNSCYFNAVISSISNCLGMSSFFLKNKYLKVIGPGNREKSEFGFLLNYIDLLVGLFEKNQTVSPKTLYNKLSVFDSNMKKGEQQDSHECLLSILNILHIASSNKLEHYHIGPEETKIHEKLLNSKKAWVNAFKDDYSIITDLFFGQYIQRLRCNVCKHTVYSYEHFIDIGLSMIQSNEDSITSIYDLLDYNFQKQIVDNNCEGKCRKSTKFTRSLKIIKLPKYLIINLKRFDKNLNKINDHIAFASDLEMSKYSVAVANQSVEYNLVSVVNHMGSMNNGHYSTMNRVFDGYWVNIDDNTTTKIENTGVCTKNAYILIYELDLL